jgi:cystathionine gamma-synthase
VLQVRHPSLPDYERGEVAHRVLRRDGQVVRAGTMVTLTVTGGDQRALRVMPAVEIGCEATSLGGVETLVSTASRIALLSDAEGASSGPDRRRDGPGVLWRRAG